MNETKFTKGLWGLQRCEGGGLLLLRGEGAGKHPQYSVQIVPKEDAYLMAAGPELYEACRRGMAQLEAVLDSLGALSNPGELHGHGFVTDEVTEVFAALGTMKAAIAKAEAQ